MMRAPKEQEARSLGEPRGTGSKRIFSSVAPSSAGGGVTVFDRARATTIG